jgi:hypothetical protein
LWLAWGRLLIEDAREALNPNGFARNEANAYGLRIARRGHWFAPLVHCGVKADFRSQAILDRRAQMQSFPGAVSFSKRGTSL